MIKKIMVLLLANITMASAGTMGKIMPENNWFISLSGGPVWAEDGKTETFYLTPDIEKTYYKRKAKSAIPEGELFLGLQGSWLQDFPLQLGLAVATTGNAKFKGTIWDDADPNIR